MHSESVVVSCRQFSSVVGLVLGPATSVQNLKKLPRQMHGTYFYVSVSVSRLH